MIDSIHVAVGVIVDQDGSVLVSQRSLKSHQGGLWEFPGGKLEAGETVQLALQRELKEELGITISLANCFPFKKIEHHYPDKSVLLDVWIVYEFSGKPHGREGQLVSWLPVQHLNLTLFPEANRSIIKMLQLPNQIGITGSESDLQEFLINLDALLRKDIKLVQLRQPSLPSNELLVWVEQARILCEQYQARLLVNSSPAAFEQTRAHGLHLNSERLLGLKSRPVSTDKLLSASCHNVRELLHAESIEVDFAVLSPVLDTRSHPGSKSLGWRRFRDIASSASLPVYSLGGMTPENLPRALKEGAFGIAAISAFWKH